MRAKGYEQRISYRWLDVLFYDLRKIRVNLDFWLKLCRNIFQETIDSKNHYCVLFELKEFCRFFKTLTVKLKMVFKKCGENANNRIALLPKLRAY